MLGLQEMWGLQEMKDLHEMWGLQEMRDLHEMWSLQEMWGLQEMRDLREMRGLQEIQHQEDTLYRHEEVWNTWFNLSGQNFLWDTGVTNDVL